MIEETSEKCPEETSELKIVTLARDVKEIKDSLSKLNYSKNIRNTSLEQDILERSLEEAESALLRETNNSRPYGKSWKL